MLGDNTAAPKEEHIRFGHLAMGFPNPSFVSPGGNTSTMFSACLSGIIIKDAIYQP